jgi:hypothetical protein
LKLYFASAFEVKLDLIKDFDAKFEDEVKCGEFLDTCEVSKCVYFIYLCAENNTLQKKLSYGLCCGFS